MIFVLTQPNLANPAALEVRTLPKQIFHRSVTILPKGWPFHRVFWRLVFEHALTRYAIALAPFPAVILLWPDMALPVSQSPLVMLIVIILFETHVISIPRSRRARLADEDTIGRVLDQLRLRSIAALTDLATRRGIEAGELHLVVEQSEMARVPPFTYVSVQHDTADGPAFLSLSPDEQFALTDRLFDADFTEDMLRRVNFAQSTFLRNTVLDPRTISAHARMAALADARPLSAAPA
ncbi:MAG: hypothetical protein AAFQ79_03255 [Pseudomonadota bacterium]